MNKLTDLLQQEISRKEFLRYIGIALLSLIGVTNVIKNLQFTMGQNTQSQPILKGYGSSSYGP